MSKKLKILASIIIALLIAAPLFLRTEKEFLEITNFNAAHGVKTRIAKFDSNGVVYVKCKFKEAGVYHDKADKFGLSEVVSQLLFRRINNLSREDTTEKLKNLGIKRLTVSAQGNNFEISFLILKDRASAALEFLANAFTEPTFSEADLEHIKEFYPKVLSLEVSSPTALMQEKVDSMLYENGIYGANPTGTSQTISSITAEDVSNFIKIKLTHKKLKMIFGGNLTRFDAESFQKILFEKISDEDDIDLKQGADLKNNLLGRLSKDQLVKINKPNMTDVVGVMVGIRLDDCDDVEKAAIHIISDALFDNVGDFVREFRKNKFSYDISQFFIEKSFSDTIYLTVFIDKNDLEKYQKFLQKKLKEYSKKINLKACHESKKCFQKLTQNGFVDMNGLDGKLKMRMRPYEKVDDNILKATAQKIFDKKNMRTVIIGNFAE